MVSKILISKIKGCYKKIIMPLQKKSWNYFHDIKCNRYRISFKNPNITIISMNCVGGVLYHDLDLKFNSPTINIGFMADEFLKFCENIEFYLSIEKLERCRDKKLLRGRTHLIAQLGDISLSLRHWNSIEEAQEKWNIRKRRINWDNIVIICSDRDGMNQKLVDRFERLPFKKIMFVNKPNKFKGKNCVYLRGYEKENSVGIIISPKGWLGKRPIDKFDWVSFLNK